MLCHDRRVEFKTSKYHSNSFRVRGNVNDGNFLWKSGCYLFQHIIFNFYMGLLYFLKNWEKSTDVCKSYKVLYVDNNAIAVLY